MEQWKQIIIDGEKWNYEVSNCGNVRNSQGLVLKPRLTKNGYLQVGINKNGKRKVVYVHRLVAIAFIPNPNELPEVNHMSEVKTDNSVENLEWISHVDNMNHGTLQERQKKSNLGKHDKPVYYVENGVAVVYPSVKATELDGYDKSCVGGCCRGERSHHKGKKWRYVK